MFFGMLVAAVASHQARREAAAERTLYAVACMLLLGWLRYL